MTLADDAFQWAVYEIWKMGNRGLFLPCQQNLQNELLQLE